MKTLDEVITALELCSTDDNPCVKCPYTEFDKNGEWACSMCGDFAKDALHYLKLFQADCERVRGQLEDLKQEYRPNDPLTWDELKGMEGKPVWVERPEWKEWLLVSEIDEGKCEMYLRDKWGNGAIVNGRNIGYWRAYRKEKNDTRH